MPLPRTRRKALMRKVSYTYVLRHGLQFPIPESLGLRVGTRVYFSLAKEETPRIYCSLKPSELTEGRFLSTRVRWASRFAARAWRPVRATFGMCMETRPRIGDWLEE